MINKIKSLFSSKHEDSEKTIQVSFIDVELRKEFAKSNMPVSQIPKSFEAHTTINIQQNDWEVVESRPMTSEEFSIKGKLTLYLRKIKKETVCPENILYSIPTISNELPAIKEGSSKLGKNNLELHEDDWEQIEFVSKDFENIVDLELKKIELIYQEGSKELDEFIAFTEIYNRNELKQPIKRKVIPYNELIHYFKKIDVLDGVTFQGVAGIVQSSFALKLETDMYLYGIEKNGYVEVMCLALNNKSNISAENLSTIETIMHKYELLLVDWCNIVKIPSVNVSLNDYLNI